MPDAELSDLQTRMERLERWGRRIAYGVLVSVGIGLLRLVLDHGGSLLRMMGAGAATAAAHGPAPHLSPAATASGNTVTVSAGPGAAAVSTETIRGYRTAQDVADLARCSVDAVREWCREGRIDGAKKQGREWVIPVGAKVGPLVGDEIGRGGEGEGK